MTFENFLALLALLLGGGLGATTASAVKGWKALREGASKKEDKAKLELARYRRDLVNRAEFAEAESQYWRDLAGQYEYELSRNGITLPAARHAYPVRVRSSDDDA